MKISEEGMYGLLVILYMLKIDCAPGDCVSHLNAAGLSYYLTIIPRRNSMSLFPNPVSHELEISVLIFCIL